MLRLQDVGVRYGATWALTGLDLSAGDREVVAVLGPSGCGKSTLLRAVAGLEPLASGSVHLAGQDVSGWTPDRRGVGLAFQDAALFPHRTVAENVAFGPRMRGWDRRRREERVAQVLALVDLADAGDRTVDGLSGGEAQRVALARAIAPRPRLLLLDEPLGALDRALHDRLLADLPAVFADAEATVLHVTHDHEEALTLADRIAVLIDGRLRQLGTPRQLWRDPIDLDVAEVLGLDQRLPGRTVDDGVATALGTWPLATRSPAGGAVEVLVLPDAPRVVSPTATVGGPRIRGRVTSWRFAGHRTQMTVTACDGTTLRVDAGRDDVTVGDDVELELDVDALRVLPAR